MINAAVEADDHLDYLRESVRTSIKMFMYMLQVIIEDGIVNNEFKSTLEASKYAAYLFSIMEGNIMLAKIMDDPKYLQIASQQLSLIIENEMIT